MEINIADFNAATSAVAADGMPPSSPEPSADGALGAFRTIHHHLLKLFDAYQAACDAQNDNARAVAVHGVSESLKTYLTLQVQVFYPAFRAAIKDGNLIAEVMANYTHLKSQVGELERLRLTDSELSRRASALEELVRQHIQFEETMIFPLLSEAHFGGAGAVSGDFDICTSQLIFYYAATTTEPRERVRHQVRAIARGSPGVGASVN
jgi:hemerythrin HHE cation binding domain-containing protein